MYQSRLELILFMTNKYAVKYEAELDGDSLEHCTQRSLHTSDESRT